MPTPQHLDALGWCATFHEPKANSVSARFICTRKLTSGLISGFLNSAGHC
jgi:hypothetical protein